VKFRKKPVVIEAVKWICTDRGTKCVTWPKSWGKTPKKWKVSCVNLSLFIPTLEGEMEASRGDWIIRGIKGEFYPCKPDIFEATYEPVKERENV
jgi:hypothetical protein